MEEFIQFSAKTKNEAITKACIELGVSSDQLEIEVVSEGKMCIRDSLYGICWFRTDTQTPGYLFFPVHYPHKKY